MPSANVFVRHATRRYSTSLEAFPSDTTLQKFEAPDGSRLELPATGALIPQSLGKILGAGVGDELEITLPGAGVPPFPVKVAALTSNTLGNLVFLSNDALRDAMGQYSTAFAGGLFNTASVQFAPGADRGQGRGRGAGRSRGRRLRAGGGQPQHRRPGPARSSRR